MGAWAQGRPAHAGARVDLLLLGFIDVQRRAEI